MTVTEATVSVNARVDRLNTVSLKRVIEPEERFDWSTLRDGQVIADSLLSINPDRYDLTSEQRVRLSREEVASMLESGIRFEAVLISAFALHLSEDPHLLDVRSTYLLHEIGEETRHSRAFLRLIAALEPAAPRLLNRGVPMFVRKRIQRSLLRHPALLYVFVLAGEEIPDLLQKLASEHPETDRLLADVNRYHRQEEARHLAFARMRLPELREESSWVERWRVRHLAPLGIHRLFDSMIDPGVYATVGLPAIRTWLRAHRSQRRRALRYEACQPVLRAVMDAGFIRPGRVPWSWRMLCGADRDGELRVDAAHG